jgi:thioredoxin reductase
LFEFGSTVSGKYFAFPLQFVRMGTWLVIGAGPSGLSVGEQLAKVGADFVIAEATNDVGGIWNLGSENSPAYESLHFISSSTMSGFPSFPMPADYPDYPSAMQIRDYLRAYADHCGVRKHIRFNTKVIEMTAAPGGGFDVQFATADAAVPAHLSTERFAGVIVANGHLNVPNEVTWPGKFNGTIMHSRSYKTRSQLQGKRVLVVGVGNSGCDIAVDAALVASKVFVSVRRGVWFAPKYIFGKPADVFASEGPHLPKKLEAKLVVPIFEKLCKLLAGDPTKYGFPRPKHRILDEIPVVNSQLLYMLGHGRIKAKAEVDRLDGDDVVFSDETRESVDLIVTATGYKVVFPFAAESLLNEKSGFDLPLKIIHPTNPDLLVAGLTEGIGPGYPTYANSASLIAYYVAAHSRSPADVQSLRIRIIEADRKVAKMKDSQGLLVDLDAYNKALTELVSTP